jgi:anti-sigma regulatory factor (Ser/Thr protein kinase)
MPTVELRFTPLPAHVRTARLLAAVLARRTGIDESAIDEVKLAVGEACARAVGIHQAHAPGEPVVVSLSDDDACFAVAVRDVGPHGADTAVEATGEPVAGVPELVDMTELAGGDPTAGMPPGFGLAVIAGLVDDVDVTEASPGTVVRMRWAPEPPMGDVAGGPATL